MYSLSKEHVSAKMLTLNTGPSVLQQYRFVLKQKLTETKCYHIYLMNSASCHHECSKGVNKEQTAAAASLC